MTTLLENALIEGLVAGMPRSKRQVGGLQESDAELIRLPGTDVLLAITTDAIAEEIELGLYRDPYLIGWMAVIVNASDLAAVGAAPFGILLNETLPADLSSEERARLQSGIRDACIACELPVFGGDTNTAQHFQVGATAVGLVEGGESMTRLGCRPGDHLFASGPLGTGTCFALEILGDNGPAKVRSNRGLPLSAQATFKPAPRLREGQLLRAYSTACMDTSDGALAALDQLMRLNDVGFVLNLTDAMHPAARCLAEYLDLPPWMMLAGLHGEFELLFTVPPDIAESLLYRAASVGWQPVHLGHVVDGPGVWLDSPHGRSALDTGRIRNLFAEPFADVQACIRRLITMEEPCTQ